MSLWITTAERWITAGGMWIASSRIPSQHPPSLSLVRPVLRGRPQPIHSPVHNQLAPLPLYLTEPFRTIYTGASSGLGAGNHPHIHSPWYYYLLQISSIGSVIIPLPIWAAKIRL